VPVAVGAGLCFNTTFPGMEVEGRIIMTVNTRAVQGRRTLSFASLDEVVADAEQLVAAPDVRMLGNWPLGTLLAHLALAINRSIDGIAFKAPLYLRLLGLFFKGRILRKGLEPGVRLPKEREAAAFPSVSSQEGLDALHQAVGRAKNEKMTARHPFFGKLTHDEWLRFHLRHAEMHLSFAVPGLVGSGAVRAG
jgi:hypothetical protein